MFNFVEDLWNKNPGLVIKAVKKIYGVNENWGDKLSFVKINDDGELVFSKTGRFSSYIIVNNFSIRTEYSGKNYQDSPMSIAWVKFMFSIYGNEYAAQYINHRNQQLDKFMAEYEEEYNNQTRKLLDEMGFQLTKGQTK